MTEGKGRSGHRRRTSPDWPTTSDHDHPSTRYLRSAGGGGDAADAEAFIPAPLHYLCLDGFLESARAALADESITDEMRAGLVEAARTRFGWTRGEVQEWVQAEALARRHMTS